MHTELVTTMKRQATQLVSELHDSYEPVLITEHGKPSAYLVDFEYFESLQHRMQILEGIARGESAALEGRTLSHDEAKTKMKKWLG